ncbi:DUF4435 domain-containing protein [Bacteroides sp. 214]|uniref:DUF4435 domain-containing protein n=1 Tax=Bacteroides sp. 214 TaxID=2302935 RepID=UPI0013D52EB5|nr:DUF4435 domain-containing protein [Bacteroides sp. 214]NDW13684.1 DUF4435 domain-containing protein [Bacteroides sp. 214]
MAKRLQDNITSKYFDAAQKLYSRKARRKIIAYVESYEDVAFWRSLFATFETDECYFQVMLPSKQSLSKGKKMVLLNTLDTENLGKSLVACVDSDFDFLLQDTTNTSRKINRNKYIFQTYAYAIENYQCYAESLHGVCVQATLNDKYLIDIQKFITRYSQTVYPLFLWMVWFYRKHDTYSFPLYDFNKWTHLKGFRLNKPYESLDDVQRRVLTKVTELEKKYPDDAAKVIELGKELIDLGVTPDTTYLYIQGHHLKDNVVMKILIPICTVLRRQREEEIKRLAGHQEQYHNELTSYQNSQMRLDAVLKKNDNYKGLYLYLWLSKDIRAFLSEVNAQM